EQRMAYGYASAAALDSQGEVVRKEALAAALPDYMRFANIREMHQPSAIGVAKEAAIDEKGLWLGAKVVDDEAWKKVVEGVYKGFSIGGFVTSRDPGDPTVITGIDLPHTNRRRPPERWRGPPPPPIRGGRAGCTGGRPRRRGTGGAHATLRSTSRGCRASTTWRRRWAPIARARRLMTTRSIRRTTRKPPAAG